MRDMILWIRDKALVLLLVVPVATGAAANRAPDTEPAGSPDLETRLQAVEELLEDGRYDAGESAARGIVTALEQDPDVDALTRARGLDVLVDALLDNGKGRYPETGDLADRALALKKKRLKKGEPGWIPTLHHRAVVHAAFDEDEDAMRLYRRALAIAEKRFGADDPEVVDPVLFVVQALVGSRDLDEASVLLDRARAIQDAHPGADPRSVAWARSLQGDLHFALGDYREAEPLYREALDVSVEELRSGHPLIATRLTDVAAVLGALGRYSEALDPAEKALEIRERELRPTHPLIAGSLASLGYLHQSVGRHEQARGFLERALALHESEPYTDELVIAGDLSNLGANAYTLGDLDGAIERTRRALEIAEKRRGSDDPELVVMLNNLATLYMQAGIPDESFALMNRALEIQQKELGPEHPTVARMLINLGSFYDMAGASHEAQMSFIRALMIQYLKLGEEHPQVAATLHQLSFHAASAGRLEEAVSILTRALVMARSELADGHPIFVEGLASLGNMLAEQGEYREARALFEQARSVMVSELGADHESVVWVDEILAGLDAREEAQARSAQGPSEDKPPPGAYTITFEPPPQHEEVERSDATSVVVKTYALPTGDDTPSMSWIRIATQPNVGSLVSLEEYAARRLAEYKRQAPNATITPVTYPDWVVGAFVENGFPHASFTGRYRKPRESGGRAIYDCLWFFFKTPDEIWMVVWNAPADLIDQSMGFMGTFLSEIEIAPVDRSRSAEAEAIGKGANDVRNLLESCAGIARESLEGTEPFSPLACSLALDGTILIMVLGEPEEGGSGDELASGVLKVLRRRDEIQAMVVITEGSGRVPDGTGLLALEIRLESKVGNCRRIVLPYAFVGERAEGQIEFGAPTETVLECPVFGSLGVLVPEP